MPEVDLAAAIHAQRHAAGGPDAITPESINAFLGHGVTYAGHADDLTSPGTYRVSASALIPANGYPEGLTAGYVTVQSGLNVSYVFQTLVTSSGNNYDGFYVRAREAGTWRPWVKHVPDDDPRLRDTGWRVIPTDTATHPLSGGTVQIRRVGNVVTFKIVNLQLVTSTSASIQFLPSSGSAAFNATGFLPSTSRLPFFANRTNSVSDRYSLVAWTSNSNLALIWYHREDISQATPNRGLTLHASTQLTGELSWFTDQAWPTTLPGTPA